MCDGPVQLELEEVRLSPGQEWYNRPNQWRFILLRCGMAYWLDVPKARELAPGELLVIPPAQTGVIRASQLGEAVVNWFGFRPDCLLGFFTLRERQWVETGVAAKNGPVACLPSTHPISKEMAELSRSVSKDSAPVERAKALILCLRFMAESMPPLPSYEPRRASAAQERFDEIIAGMPDAELIRHSSEELARLCGCTPRHLNRLFRLRFGAPTRARRTELRLLKACQLLEEDSSRPVAQVAADCGYHSLSLFNSLFRRRFGVSPSEWRDRASG